MGADEKGLNRGKCAKYGCFCFKFDAKTPEKKDKKKKDKEWVCRVCNHTSSEHLVVSEGIKQEFKAPELYQPKDPKDRPTATQQKLIPLTKAAEPRSVHSNLEQVPSQPGYSTTKVESNTVHHPPSSFSTAPSYSASSQPLIQPSPRDKFGRRVDDVGYVDTTSSNNDKFAPRGRSSTTPDSDELNQLLRKRAQSNAGAANPRGGFDTAPLSYLDDDNSSHSPSYDPSSRSSNYPNNDIQPLSKNIPPPPSP